MCQASKSVKAEEEKMPEAKDMATFLEGAWNVSVVDVESTLRHICKKVLTDTSVSKAELNRRAEAMLRAGTVFLRTESPDSLKDDGQRKTLRESLEAFVGPLSGAAAGGESDDEELTPSHSASLVKPSPHLPTSPYISPTSPHISLYLPYTSLHLPVSPLHLPGEPRQAERGPGQGGGGG